VKAVGLEPDDILSRSMGAGGEDLMLSPAARRKLPFSFECKKHKSFSVYKHYEQAIDNSSKYDPVLLIEGDRKEPLAVISLELFVRLVSK
tara:strand:+ start:234 stop:503 length:270 start_codon:yes stop_codon:yes gene_type:complete